MEILVTGAGGFVGSALVRRLAGSLAVGDRLLATDIAFHEKPPLPGVEYMQGAIDDREHLARLTSRPLDKVFHLATVAGVQSADFKLGKRVNLDATMALLDALAEQEHPARLIYSSSAGVFGVPFPTQINDETLPTPGWSYGAHKLVSEILITDYARAGLVDGLALRFPGIVARPEGSTTMLSAFVNNIFYAARAGREFALPLNAEDGTWLMSLRRCLDNVIHASDIPREALPERRAWMLPALFIRMRELVEALAARYGDQVLTRIRYEPVAEARRLFAMVPLDASGARALGMVGDETPESLVANVIAENPALRPGPASV